MNKDEIREIVQAVLEEGCAKGHGNFYIDSEKHYKQHERLDRFLELYETTSNVVIKTLVGMLVVGMVIVAAISIGWHK